MNTLLLRSACLPSVLMTALWLCAGCGSTRPAASATAPSSEQVETSRTRNPGGDSAVDKLLVDALRRHSEQGDPATALMLAAQAAQRAPERADVTWVHLLLCSNTANCATEPLQSRLRTLDPSNGATWLAALRGAHQRRDRTAEVQILDAIGRSTSFNLYWNPLVSRLARAGSVELAGTTTPVTQSLDDVVEWLGTLARPDIKSLVQACDASRTANTADATRCLRIAAVLRRGDTFIAESLGLEIAKRLSPLNSSTQAEATTRMRALQYQFEAAGQINAAQVEREKFSAEHLELLSKLRREQDVALAILRWAGQPINPPADYVAESK